MEGEDDSEVKFWSVFYESKMLIRGRGRTGEEKETFQFLCIKKDNVLCKRGL